MKILFLLPEYPSLGGVQTVTTQMANYFQAVGCEVSILSLPPGQLLVSDISASSFAGTLRIALDQRVKLTYLPDTSDYNSKQNLNFIRNYVEQGGISIVINQGAFSKAYLLFRNNKQHKVINVLRGCPAWEPVRKRKLNTFKTTVLSTRGINKRIPALLRYLALKTIPGLATTLAQKELFSKIVHAARFVVLAPGYIEELHANWPAKIARGQILSISNPLTGQATVSARKPQLMYAGRLSREDKRIDRLLRIWKQIEEQVPGWSFRIIGEGPEKAKLEKYAERLGLKRLSFESPRMDDTLYAEASIICLSSSYEGYGMVLLEARQAGIVPVSFDCSAGVRDVISHQRNGLLIPAFDENAFALSLLELIRDESQRNKLAQQAIEDARQNDVERIGPQWIALFEDLLTENRTAGIETREAAGNTAIEKQASDLPEADSLEVLISTYGKPCSTIVDRLPKPMEGIAYLISIQGVMAAETTKSFQDQNLHPAAVPEAQASEGPAFEQFEPQRPDLRLSYTDSKGIAANRNNSIKAARGEIVWLLDDDVRFEQADLKRILDCYRSVPEVDVACFCIRTPEGKPYRHYKEQAFRMKSLDDVRDVSSIEITFRLDSVRNKGLMFDERFGLGREWPCGEEFLFLAACLTAGLHIHYFPFPVVEHPCESTIKKLSQYSPVLLEKSGAVNAVIYGRKAFLRNLLSLIKARKAIKNEGLSARDFLAHKNRGSRKLLNSDRDGRS
ncbi:MAG: glycosyltransferase [Bacteroidales bacterium]|nr:glycosyltransferase [Bacteroidales bacterium]MDD3430676.1 glycosyltransferase [Bacteroidales bacterium]MDD4361368.1 glycosyltransferase [Bacteroidales bacterium]MDD4430482.1 glycosyltransferase [Bacteroidales bacterium]